MPCKIIRKVTILILMIFVTRVVLSRVLVYKDNGNQEKSGNDNHCPCDLKNFPNLIDPLGLENW